MYKAFDVPDSMLKTLLLLLCLHLSSEKVVDTPDLKNALTQDDAEVEASLQVLRVQQRTVQAVERTPFNISVQLDMDNLRETEVSYCFICIVFCIRFVYGRFRL